MKDTQLSLDLLTLSEAAQYVRASQSTFSKWHRAGLIPAVRLGGRSHSRLRFRRSDLDAFVAAATTPATSGPLAEPRS